MRWWLAVSALVALGGAAQAGTEPPPCGMSSYPPAQEPVETAPRDQTTECERKIQQKLCSRSSMNFQDTPLSQIIDDLKQMTGINMVADTVALEEAGVRLEQPLSIKVEDMSLKSALNILLKQARLTYVIKDGLLQITTEERAHGRITTVIYPVVDLVTPIGSGESEMPPFLCRNPALMGFIHDEERKRAAGMTCEEVLIKVITGTIEPNTWSEFGGKATIQYFPLGLALVVSQTQDVQEQIQDLLAAVRRMQAEEDKPYQLEVKQYEAHQSGLNMYQSWPRITFVRGQQMHVLSGRTVMVRDGTLQDLLPVGTSLLEAPLCRINPGPWISPAEAARKAMPPVSVEVGMSLRAKLTSAEGKYLRLDVTFQTNEMTEVTPEGMRVVGQSYRFLQRVETGKPVRLVLEKDNDGAAKKWLECTVTEVQRPKAQEQMYPSP
jgi:hypothetical protein